MKTAKLTLDGKEYSFPVVTGTEDEVGIDITKLRAQTGAITLDPGFGNTGSCQSGITFIDGENGILRYRGYPLEELAKKASFSEVAYLLIYDHLPSEEEFLEWRRHLTLNSFLHESMLKFFDHFPVNAHPMAIMSSMIATMSGFYDPEENEPLEQKKGGKEKASGKRGKGRQNKGNNKKNQNSSEKA